MSKLVLKGISKSFGKAAAVRRVSLEVLEGELAVLLGPSGCGKTTLLRCIAGLETPDEGEIFLDDQPFGGLPPRARDVAMVFQNYALFPLMNVFENIAFPLKVRGVPEMEREGRVKEVAKQLDIRESLSKLPRELSGGEQQRVALGRAIVRQPKLFLMDEPLSNLDAPLRVQMRTLLKKIQKEIGVTTIYVTHDQAEAMSLANKVGVMDHGTLLQYDTPELVYARPINAFVARFIGTYSTNLIDMRLEKRNGIKLLVGEGIEHALHGSLANVNLKGDSQKELTLAIRPEDIGIKETRNSESSLDGEVTLIESLGATNLLEVRVGSTFLKASVASEFKSKLGQRVWLDFDDEKLRLYDRKTGAAVS